MTSESDFTPILKVGTRKGNALERIREDAELNAAGLTVALGGNAEMVLKDSLMKRSPDKVVVFQQGEVGDSLLFVVSGTARLFKKRDAGAVELGAAQKGDIIGETEVLSGSAQREMSVVALGTLELIEIPRKALLIDGSLPASLQKLLSAVQQARSSALAAVQNATGR